jgi:hypothetical protein
MIDGYFFSADTPYTYLADFTMATYVLGILNELARFRNIPTTDLQQAEDEKRLVG